MCGIIGYVGSKQAMPILINGLSKLEYRGYDSAGVAIHDGLNLGIIKAKGHLVNLENKVKDISICSNLGIGHTRWATHGAPSDINSHPHNSSKITVVHNGIIENYMHIKEELIKEGYNFLSDTDTETVAHLIDLYYGEGENFFDAVYKAIEKIEGSYALAILCKDFPDTVIAVRKDSPLIIGIGNEENFIASDMPAILNYTRDIYLLDENEVAVITKDEIKIFDEHKTPIKKDVYKVDWNIEAAEKGGFEHFMLKEIYEQPKVVKDSISSRLKENSVDFENLMLTKNDLDKIDRIYVVACGTAYHAGLIGKFLIESLVRIPVSAEFASEFRYKNPIIDDRTLVIVVSQSGETADTVAAMRVSKKSGARVLAIVNVIGSTIAREADEVLYTLAGPEISVASTKAFSAQVAVMYLLTCHIALELNKIDLDQFILLKDELEKLPAIVSSILDQSEKIKRFAQKYLNVKNVFFIGRGIDYIVAMEGSLKLKEISYIHSEPYAAGELKHGPIALIEENTLIFAIVTQKDLFEKTANNIKECKARDAKILAVALEGDREIEKFVDDVFYIPDTNQMFTPLASNIVQQLFAYYLSVLKGNDVDKPRNLAKSVTVE